MGEASSKCSWPRWLSQGPSSAFCDSVFWAQSSKWGDEGPGALSKGQGLVSPTYPQPRNSYTQWPGPHPLCREGSRNAPVPHPPPMCTCRHPLRAQKLITATIWGTLSMCQGTCKVLCMHILINSPQHPLKKILPNLFYRTEN